MSRLRFLRYLWKDLGRRVISAPRHPEPQRWPEDRVTAAWLGHATVLINFHGCVILTDPVFFSRVGISIGPITFGPKRYISCALRPDELPPIDLILLSHAHMDHLDLRSLRRLSRETPVITASHTADIFSRRRFRQVQELGWDESLELFEGRGGLTITALRLRHWGARMRTDTHRAYNAYLLERAGRRICFVGDTARTDGRPLGSRGPIDLMILPISAYNPWITSHCTPEEAVDMANEAHAEYLMPVHHETFKLSWEPMDEPIRRFRAALAANPARLALAEVGETFTLPAPAP
jgi:L-ascorbate metabolism protein UlaG (beta-lactamase superfamily)